MKSRISLDAYLREIYIVEMTSKSKNKILTIYILLKVKMYLVFKEYINEFRSNILLMYSVHHD